mmetsp:Transcript_35710/g.86190  ORF Transcript_35710/g.86190 Transcript_35710/m.86190 type:complete len:91 (-) Transcript_35710:786-1058(-)
MALAAYYPITSPSCYMLLSLGNENALLSRRSLPNNPPSIAHRPALNLFKFVLPLLLLGPNECCVAPQRGHFLRAQLNILPQLVVLGLCLL